MSRLPGKRGQPLGSWPAVLRGSVGFVVQGGSVHEQTTPPPLYFSGVPKTAPVSYMTSAERSTYRAAAWRATKLFGAIGELISRELLVVDEFGWAPGADALTARVRDEVMELWRAHEAAQADVASRTGNAEVRR